MLKKRILAACLAALMIVCALPASAFARSKKELNYLAIGASNTNGFGLDGYMDYYGELFSNGYLDSNKYLKQGESFFESAVYYNRPYYFRTNGNASSGFMSVGTAEKKLKSYPVLLSDALSEYYDVNLYQYAQCAMRYEDLRFLIDDSYNGDSYTEWRFYHDDELYGYEDENGNCHSGWFVDQEKLLAYQTGEKGSYKLPLLRKAYKDAIKDADIITVDLGVNSFGPYLLNSIFDTLLDPSKDMNSILPEKLAKARLEITDMLKEIAGEDSGKTIDEIMGYLDAIVYAYASYKINLVKCLDMIRAENKDAQITIIGMKNIIEDYNFVIDGIKIPLGKLLSAVINSGNLFARSYAKTHLNCEYVSLRNADIETLKESFIADYSRLLEESDNNIDNFSLTPFMKDWINVYDNDTMIGRRTVFEIMRKYYFQYDKSKVLLWVSENYNNWYEIRDEIFYGDVTYQEEFDRVCETAEKVVVRFVYDGLDSYDLNYDVIDRIYGKFKVAFPGDENKWWKENSSSPLVRNPYDLVDDIIDLAIEGKSASEIYEKLPDLLRGYGLENQEDIKACLTLYSNLLSGNSELLHSSEKGHETIYKLILNSWAKDSNCLRLRYIAKRCLKKEQ